MHPNVHSSTIYNSQDMEDKTLNPSAHQQMIGLRRCENKIIYIYIYKMEYYSAIKKNEILPSAAMRMDLENIMLSEISQRETNTV